MIASLLSSLVWAASPSALDDPSFRFCHEPGFDAEEAEQWCALLEGQPEDRCPGLRRTCAGERSEASSAGCAGGEGSPAAGRWGGAGRRERPPQGCDWQAPDTGGWEAMLRWLGGFLMAALLLVVLRLVIKYLRREGPTEPTPLPEATALVAAPEEDVPEAPSTDLLDLARAALRDGRLLDAVLFARAAALRTLADRGELSLHRSTTDREYTRQVADASRDPLRRVLRAVEAARWAGLPDPRQVADAVEAAERLVRRVAPLLLVLGGGAWADVAQAQEYRHAPYGDAGFSQLLEDAGFDVTWRLRGLAELDQDLDVLWLDTHRVPVTEEGWGALHSWVSSGHVLVLIGLPPPDWGAELTLVEVQEPTLSMAEWVQPTGLTGPRFPPGPVQAYCGPALPWVTVSGQGECPEATLVAQLNLDAGVVLLLAEPRFGQNGLLVAPENEAFLADMLLALQVLHYPLLDEEIEVQLATSGVAESAESPTSSLARAELLPFVLQLLLTWLLLVAWKGWPLGVPRPEAGEGRARFVEHIDALARGLQRDPVAVSRLKVRWVLERKGGAAVERALLRTGLDPRAATQALQDAERLVKGEAIDPGAARQLADQLWRLFQEGA